jgi:hypothetical protein
MGQQAIRRVLEEFSIASMARGYEAVYNSIVKARSRQCA